MLRNEVAAELTEKLGRRELSEAGTREAQAALEVKVEGSTKKKSATSAILRCSCCCCF